MASKDEDGVVEEWSDVLPVTAANYDLCHKIGGGGQADVYVVADKVTRKRYAAKVFNDNHSGFLREAEILLRLRFCPGVVRVERVLSESRAGGSIIMQLCGQSLFDKVVRDGPLSERDAAAVILKLAQTIKALHSRHVVHRDLKLENVFLELDAKDPADVVIGDFGLATHHRGELRQYCGTEEFMAPEVAELKDKGREESSLGYTGSIDSWGLGVIAFELLQGRGSKCDIERMRSGEMPAGISSDAADLIHKLMAMEARKRLGPTKVINHPWIKRILCGEVKQRAMATKTSAMQCKGKRKPVHNTLKPAKRIRV